MSLERRRRPCLEAAAALLVLTTSSGGAAAGSEGVHEINQTVAAVGGAGGVAALDPPGFPVVLAVPGSYRLTGNLDVRGETNASEVTAIEVTTSGVRLDLNGFAIFGPTSCSGAGDSLACVSRADGSGGHGIHVGAGGTFVREFHVHGGTISGMGNHGVHADGLVATLKAERLRVAINGRGGLYSERMLLLESSVVVRNGGAGIECQGSSSLVGNVVAENLEEGIACLQVNVIRSNLIDDNGNVGIRSGGSIVANTIHANDTAGIELPNGGTLVGNSLVANGNGILFVGEGNGLVRANVLESNGIIGLDAFSSRPDLAHNVFSFAVVNVSGSPDQFGCNAEIEVGTGIVTVTCP